MGGSGRHSPNPSKVPTSWGDDVTLVVGALSDAEAVDRAVQGADAVFSALGHSLDRNATGLPPIEVTRNIITAMQRHGVRATSGTAPPASSTPVRKPTWQPGPRRSSQGPFSAASRTNSSI